MQIYWYKQFFRSMADFHAELYWKKRQEEILRNNKDNA